MSRLDHYKTALLAVLPDVSDNELNLALESGGSQLVEFIIAHGLGPIWYERVNSGSEISAAGTKPEPVRSRSLQRFRWLRKQKSTDLE